MASSLAAKDSITTDGRKARSTKTRGLIVEAMMALIESGNLAPTSEEVAAKAKVGHRTVFRHFEDMDTLYEEIDARLGARLADLIDGIALKGSLAHRVESLVAARTTAYEQIKMFRRATTIRAWDSPFLQDNQARYAKFLRKRLFVILPELSDAEDTVPQAVELLLSIDAWEQFRIDQKLSVKKARQVMQQAVLKLLK